MTGEIGKISSENKEFAIIETDNYFGDDILNKKTGERYRVKYDSFRGTPRFKKIFEVSKMLSGTEYKIWRNYNLGIGYYYQIHTGTYAASDSDGDALQFNTIPTAINFIIKLETGKINPSSLWWR